jgi:GT2 family glycosyltransferase
MKLFPGPLPTDLPSREALHRRLHALEAALRHSQNAHARTLGLLRDLRDSKGWKLVLRWRRFRQRWLPAGTRRQAVIDRCIDWLCALRQVGRPRDDNRGFWSIPRDYPRWIARWEPTSLELQCQRQTRLEPAPRISLLLPADQPGDPLLGATLQSVRQQTYANWELTVSVDCEPVPSSLADSDPRVCLCRVPPRSGLVERVNALGQVATGEYVVLLTVGDTLAPFTLFELVRAIGQHADADLIYSDEDRLEGHGRVAPLFKPDWSPETLRSQPYLGRLAAFRRELFERVGGYRPGFDGAEDYDLALRATEQARRVVHVPRVLYHRRRPTVCPGEAGRRALCEHLRRQGVAADVCDGLAPGTFQVCYALPRRPLVSILIPNRDQPELLRRLIASIRRASYEAREIVVVENHSRLPETFAYYRELERQGDVRVLTWRRPFNYSAVNNFAAAQARGEVLLFLNNDVEAMHPDWLERLLEHALRPEVGIVGAKLYFPDDTIQHAGLLLGVGGSVVHGQAGLPRASAGYAQRLLLAQNVSAVTGACLMIRKAVFDELGGFDERFVLTFNDVDLCLKARQHGYAVIWTPHAELYHHERATRGPTDPSRHRVEETRFLAHWSREIEAGDPYYNPNLTTRNGSFALNLGDGGDHACAGE